MSMGIPESITAHPYPICICLYCGPPWRGDQYTESIDRLIPRSWMSLCPRCGSKRCDGAVDHRKPCRGAF